MAFSWDGRFVLRRVDETDPGSHRIYLHSANRDDITDAINVIDQAPVKASMTLYQAIADIPPAPWLVKLAGASAPVLMGRFQLKRIEGAAA